MTGRGAPPRCAAMLGMLAALLVASCGDDSQGAHNAASSGSGSDGALVSVAQADQAARQWWSDRQQALARRDAAALTRLEADPGVLVTLEELRVATATGRALIAKPQDPLAVRVHVPAEQSWPVPVLAVFDVASGDAGKSTAHLAALLVQRGPNTPLVGLETVTLDAPEPAFDVDASGYVHMIAVPAQPTTLSRSASDLSQLYGSFMSTLGHGGPTPSPAAFAPGTHTTGLAEQDATFAAAAAAHQRGSVGGVDLDYIPLNFPTPVFALSGGGGFTLLAVQRDETLHPLPGQSFLQDANRKNYGLDLAPGQYQVITMHSVLMLAAHMPAGGAPVEVVGLGGGVYSEG